jgi:hypothetical protein
MKSLVSMKSLLLGVSACVALLSFSQSVRAGEYDSLIARHAAANGLPESLVRRVMMKESGGRSHLISAGNYGLMQIRHGTAKGIGYTGSAQGLLDPETNMAYATKYLAGAYRVAGGNQDRAVSLYQRGYYYDAKRQGLTPVQTQVATAPGPLQVVPSAFRLASAPIVVLTPPAPREEQKALREEQKLLREERREERKRARAVAAMQPVAPVSDPSFPPEARPMAGAHPIVQPHFVQPMAVQTVPKGKQRSEPGIMDRLASALSTDGTKRGSSKPGTWTKRILTQEAEAKRVEKVRAANKVAQ